NRGGARVGHMTASCIVVEIGDDPKETALSNCTTVFRLAGGEIVGAGVVPFERTESVRPTDVNAIAGGTGVYAGVWGTLESEPLRQPAHVRVDDDPLCVAALRGDDVRGLARDARQAQQLRHRGRHLAAELFDQHSHRAAQRLRLLPEEAGLVDVALELLLRY